MLLELVSLPWMLALGSFLLQKKGQVKCLVMDSPWDSLRPLLDRECLFQEPLMESLNLLLHLQRGLQCLGQSSIPLMELVELAVA